MVELEHEEFEYLAELKLGYLLELVLEVFGNSVEIKLNILRDIVELKLC